MERHDPYAIDNEADRQAQQQAIEDLRWLMADGRGRRLMWRLLVEQSGLFRLSFTGNDWTAFNEGARNVGLAHFAALQAHCPDEFLVMMKENRNGR